MRQLSATAITVGIGIGLVVIGYAVLSATGTTTLRMCGTSTGYHLTGVSLTTVSYYDGCNWVTASNVALAVPIGLIVIAIGIVFGSYRRVAKPLRSRS